MSQPSSSDPMDQIAAQLGQQAPQPQQPPPVAPQYPPPPQQQGGAPYPGYGAQAGYPPQGQPGYPPPGYPQQPGYPPPGYPQQPGYPPPGYPPQGYPQQPGYPPQMMYPQMPPMQVGNPRANSALVYGIISVVLGTITLVSQLGFAGIITGSFAVFYGITSLNVANKYPTKPGRGQAIAGIVLGSIAILFALISIVLQVSRTASSTY